MPTTKPDDPSGGPYARARTWGGLALLACGILLTLIDAFSADFEMDKVELTLIFGTALLLLAVEGARGIIGR